MNVTDPCTVTNADWQRDADAIQSVRHAVFIIEQGIPATLEWDGLDPGCGHALVWDATGRAIATGRLLPDGRIGRMAVLPEWRGRGIGRLLLSQLIGMAAAQGHSRVYLHAQVDVAGFYQAAGFRESGQPFTEAGIKHVAMIRSSI
ncbi:MAG: GNAT family N-acetyltransferase [Gammaproteobacteria bacterium]|nr:GNAT family N-acetyltransferase [Gammaproteobacteria bacterium]